GRTGIREWHRDNRRLDEVIYRLAGLNVWILPAGQAKVDPLELLKSTRIPDLLCSLNAAFDWVLIDSPPLLPLADSEIISRIRSGRTGIREWHRDNRRLDEVIYRLAGLNVWILPAGQAKVDPLELLKSTRIPDLLCSLNAAFDWVLIDSPPLLPLADSEIISRI